MTSPVIFLDIDGVLNTYATTQRWPEGTIARGIDPRHAAHLTTLLEVTDARVVVSSAWRMVLSFGKIKRALIYQGDVPQQLLRRADKIPSGGHCRGAEIEKWLEAHGRPHYVILDDNDDMLPEQMDRFVLVERGLGAEHVARAIRTLKGGER